MSSDNYLLRIREISRQSIKYKVLSIIFGLSFIGAVLYKNIPNSKDGLNITAADCIAKIVVNGPIMADSFDLSKIDKICDQDNIKAVIVEINSPGGETGHSERMYASLKRVASKKPLVSQMKSIAASGGYLIALAGNHIFANNLTITGSIGVISNSLNAAELLEKIGIKLDVFRSGSSKALPNRFERMTPEAEEACQARITGAADFFKNLVIKERNLSEESAQEIADGRVIIGLKAKQLGLVDSIYGTDNEITDWLVANKNISKDLKVEEINIKIEEKDFTKSFTKMIINTFQSVSNYFNMSF